MKQEDEQELKEKNRLDVIRICLPTVTAPLTLQELDLEKKKDMIRCWSISNCQLHQLTSFISIPF
jgi:hypothetical protein